MALCRGWLRRCRCCSCSLLVGLGQAVPYRGTALVPGACGRGSERFREWFRCWSRAASVAWFRRWFRAGGLEWFRRWFRERLALPTEPEGGDDDLASTALACAL